MKRPKEQSEIVTRGKTDNVLANRQMDIIKQQQRMVDTTTFIPVYECEKHMNYSQMVRQEDSVVLASVMVPKGIFMLLKSGNKSWMRNESWGQLKSGNKSWMRKESWGKHRL